MNCTADQCREGRIACTRTECGYGEDKPIATPGALMAAAEVLGVVIVTAGLAAIVHTLWSNWPVAVALFGL